MNRPIQEQMVVLGEMTLGGVVNHVQDLAGSLQLAMDSGAKRILLPMASASDIPTVPAELFSKFQISFYAYLSYGSIFTQNIQCKLNFWGFD